VSDLAALWDWRRTVADLYAAIRRHDDPRAAHAVWRATRARLFATHPQSPIEPDERAAYAGPHLYDYDPALRLLASLTPVDGGRVETLDAGADGPLPLRPFAITAGLMPSIGAELTVYWIDGYGGGVFLPFADATSGTETYGGGRYLLDTIKGADLGTDPDGRIVLDFNFAYCPSCAYSPRYVCPLAPRANRLACPIRAGEMLRA
jgi:uncharacterized protein (DUF1684 family)